MRNLSRKIDFLVEKVRFSCGDDEMGRHGRKMSKIVSLVRVNRRPRAPPPSPFMLFAYALILSLSHVMSRS